MGELEDRLNSILSSPEEMEKIMGIARSLSENAAEKEQSEKPSGSNFDPSSVFGSIDPKMLGAMGKFMGEFNHTSNEKTAVIRSIRPFLKKERRDKLDRASELARMAKLAKMAFSEMPGGDKDA